MTSADVPQVERLTPVESWLCGCVWLAVAARVSVAVHFRTDGRQNVERRGRVRHRYSSRPGDGFAYSR